MDICFRADGGSTIGMGHIMRTLVLAKELSKRHNVFYACKIDTPLSDKYKAGIKRIKDEGFNIVYIDEKNINADVLKIKADCIITDSYSIDEKYFDLLKNQFRVSGCFDDENICKYFNVDFLINQNIYSEDLNYKVNNNTKLILGCDYVILREEFRQVQQKVINRKINKIMVTVGGSDNNNITEKIIRSLSNLKFCKLEIVIGPGFQCNDRLKLYENENIVLNFNANMSKLIMECDLAVSSCGTTLYELAAYGTPTIGIVVSDDQFLAAESLDKKGIIKYSNLKNLYNDILGLSYEKRCKMSKLAKNLVDGNGYKRIVGIIEEVCTE